MTRVKTQNYTETKGKEKYRCLAYAPETAAGLLELNLEQLYGFMSLWGRPQEDPSDNVRGRWNWDVCWLDFVQCQFLTDLRFQHDLVAAERFISELCGKFGDRYPTTLQHLWSKDGLDQMWEAQQNAELPADLEVVKEQDGKLILSEGAQRFCDRVTKYDEDGIVLQLILQAPTAPGDEPILIMPGLRSGYPTIRAVNIEFVGPLYHFHGLQEVLDMYESNGITATEAKAVADYTATHYIEPMHPHQEEELMRQGALPPRPT